MAILGDPSATRPRDAREAERAFDALVLKQLLAASGAFRSTGIGGSSLFSDMIVDALADSLADAGRPDGGAPRPGGLSLLPPGLLGRLEAEAAQPEALLAPRGLAAFARSNDRQPSDTLVSHGHPGDHAPHPRPLAALSPGQLVDGGSALTSGFGRRIDPLGDGHRHHQGVDLAAAEGSDIAAAADGVVRRAGARGGYGQAVEIDHGGGVTSLYAHASELLVAEGDRVSKGQPIAKVGQTGRSTGPHLHFELRVRDRPVDPIRALKAYGERVE